MVHIQLTDVQLRIPIYDANSLRLFKRHRFGKGGVGSHDFVGNTGVLQVQALSDINMKLEGGDRVALIGHNGAGKTTLLRYLAGIYPASSGTLDMNGSVYFYGGITPVNPDASGYENIKLAMQLGQLPKDKLDDYVKDVEEFTELGEYLHMPTRIYSAGMGARLSFAIATMHKPDILLIDEVIGAGDARFADKVESRIRNFAHKDNIVVVASHSDALLRQLCNKGVVFEAGRMTFFGGIEEAIGRYADSAHKK